MCGGWPCSYQRPDSGASFAHGHDGVFDGAVGRHLGHFRRLAVDHIRLSPISADRSPLRVAVHGIITAFQRRGLVFLDGSLASALSRRLEQLLCERHLCGSTGVGTRAGSASGEVRRGRFWRCGRDVSAW
jgi:hypothetical protein